MATVEVETLRLPPSVLSVSMESQREGGGRGGGGGACGDASSAAVGVVSAEGLSLVKETQVAVVAKVTEVPEVETLRLPPSLPSASADAQPWRRRMQPMLTMATVEVETLGLPPSVVVSATGLSLMKETEVAAVAKVSGLPDEETRRPPPSLPSVSADAQP